MDFELEEIKQEVERLKQECYEKSSENLALIAQNNEFKEQLHRHKANHSKTQSSRFMTLAQGQDDIIYPQENYNTKNQPIFDSNRKLSLINKNSLIANAGAYTIQSASIIPKIFKGRFERIQNLNAMIPISDWEYVIVCPNPDFDNNDRSGITIQDALRHYKMSFKPKFSKNIKDLRVNQQAELQAFKQVFNSLIPSGNADQKCVKNGKRFVMENGSIKDTGEPAKDFLTLMRNILLVKLGLHLGLHTKQVMSSNSQYIYILVCPDDSDLQNEANAIGYNLQMEIGEVDLPSLEPCDKNLRPLRILKTSDERIKEKLKEIKNEFSDIMEMLKTTESDENEYPGLDVTDLWDGYLEYLTEFQKGLKEMETYKILSEERNACLAKIMRKSMEKANVGKKKHIQLKNMWEHMGFNKPLSPYFDYIRDQKFKNIWKKYETQHKEKKGIFRSTDRLKLLQSLISRQVNLHYLAQKEIIKCSFPLKNDYELYGSRLFTDFRDDPYYEDISRKMLDTLYGPSCKGLLNNWDSKINFGDLPINKIRNYFGEKIGLYFAFISYFSKVLCIPSFTGIVVFVLQRIYNPEDNIIIIANVLYCIYVSVWATVFIEFWKRSENCLAIKWGQTDYEDDEAPRPQFYGTLRRSPIDDEMEDVYFNPNDRYKYFVCQFL
ncbi:hypothetical protein SteCoe_14312 [Stentor coeruleus]|uniref:Anoctamin transmembrane domain-containing protein n=1 Tax=Stentor coeruleus TaxID=5963 RepID=A0A1R2C6B8_9CILI|nr:hypothetical protein SteCoe_14312 [Stentor coeruleus]